MEGESAILRTKKTSNFLKEITGDIYTTKPINAKNVEILGEDNKWYPIIKFMND